MKTMTKLFALGALGAIGVIGAVATNRAVARRREDESFGFDYGDLDEPIIVTEEVVVVTEAGPYEIEMELVSPEKSQSER